MNTVGFIGAVYNSGSEFRNCKHGLAVKANIKPLPMNTPAPGKLHGDWSVMLHAASIGCRKKLPEITGRVSMPAVYNSCSNLDMLRPLYIMGKARKATSARVSCSGTTISEQPASVARSAASFPLRMAFLPNKWRS